jgi:RHS repeat-associated protein
MNKKFYKYKHIFFLCYINGESKTYTYDAEGNRTRKVVEKNNVREEKYYINGYEVFRKYTSDSLDFERKTLNISDDEKVFVRVEQKTDENEVVRYQYDNHLGSACLELDTAGQIISYEEYHPFGTTSYRSGRTEVEVSLKRYKYNSKERDEETGLYYYGMRYYAAWLCRFVSVDPLQFEYPNLNAYHYCTNNPIRFIDTDGRAVRLANAESFDVLLSSLPAEAKSMIIIDDNNFIDLNSVNAAYSQFSDSGNLQALRAIVADERIVDFNATSISYDYINVETGEKETYNFQPPSRENQFQTKLSEFNGTPEEKQLLAQYLLDIGIVDEFEVVLS